MKEGEPKYKSIQYYGQNKKLTNIYIFDAKVPNKSKMTRLGTGLHTDKLLQRCEFGQGVVADRWRVEMKRGGCKGGLVKR